MQGDLDRAGRGITIGLNEGRVHAAPGQVVEQRPAKRVAADAAGHHGVVAELERLDGGVERRASKRGAGGEQVVKRLAQADDDWRRSGQVSVEACSSTGRGVEVQNENPLSRRE